MAQGRLLWTLVQYMVIIPAITLALLEVTLRVYDRISPSYVLPGDDYNRFRDRPGAPDYDTRLNELGFKDQSISVQKPESVYRVLALGDSFAFGVVPYRNNYLTILEQRLDSDRRQVEVLNFGIPAIGPHDYHAILVKEGLAYSPDMVLVNFYTGNAFNLRDRVARVIWPVETCWAASCISSVVSSRFPSG